MRNSASRSLCISPLSRNLTLMLMTAMFQTLSVANVRPVIAPIPPEVSSSHFTVSVNGRSTPVMHAAGGYYVLNFDVDGAAKITVTASDPHYWDSGVEVQPMRFGIRPERIRRLPNPDEAFRGSPVEPEDNAASPARGVPRRQNAHGISPKPQSINAVSRIAMRSNSLRGAPRAAAIAICCLRPAARARRRFAMLMQPTSSNPATATSKISRGTRLLPTSTC